MWPDLTPGFPFRLVFLQNVYFATDTESAVLVVREAFNGIWDAAGNVTRDGMAVLSPEFAQSSRNIVHSSSVILWVINEIEFAMEQEPGLALESDVQ